MIDVSDLVGLPYKPHGRGNAGYDCYGLVMEVCRRQGVNLPEYDYTDTAGMIENEAKAVLKDKRALKIDEPVDGALILFHTFKGLNTHIGIYVGDGLFIHSRIGRGVCLERLRPYQNCITGVYVWQG